MQRRLTLALVLTALASIVLVGVGIMIMSRLGARSDAERQIVAQLEAIGELSADGRRSPRELTPALDRSRDAFDFELLVPVRVSGTGSIDLLGAPGPRGGRPGQPPGSNTGGPDLASIMLDAERLAALEAGETVVIADGDRVVGVRTLIGADATAVANRADGTVALLASQRIVPLPRQVRTWLLLSGSLVLLGAVAAGLVLGRRLVEPLQRIRDTTAAIAAGDLSARTEVTGTDEIGELGRSVNHMAAELDRSKQLDRQFLMSVSHDLRTPLTVIAGYAEALGDAAVSDRADTTAVGRIIGGQARRLERLVGDLLDLARLDANRFRFEHRDVDPGVVAGRAVAGLATRADEVGITVDFSRPDDGTAPLRLRLDPDRLDQIITNLVENALRFARSAVSVSVEHRPDRGDGPSDSTVDIIVADDGPGIPADDLPHIFDRLYVGRAGDRPQENSTGLGLAIVHELTTAMGGSIEVRSPTVGIGSNGSGAMFRLRFPLPSPPSSVGS